MKAIGIRELKDRLSGYLDEVRAGEVLLVTDRGTVIAEIHRPSPRNEKLTPLEQRLRPYIEKGLISHASPARPEVYGRSPVAIPAGRIDAALDDLRGEH